LANDAKLLWAVIVAIPLVGVRVIYSVVIAFVDWRADGGSLAVQVVFGTIPEFLVMITYIAAGIVTRNLASDRTKLKSGSSRNQNNLV
jgi:hypothetical protein